MAFAVGFAIFRPAGDRVVDASRRVSVWLSRSLADAGSPVAFAVGFAIFRPEASELSTRRGASRFG
jgi:hypothetical protein